MGCTLKKPAPPMAKSTAEVVDSNDPWEKSFMMMPMSIPRPICAGPAALCAVA